MFLKECRASEPLAKSDAEPSLDLDAT
jgi:hypothetical protein